MEEENTREEKDEHSNKSAVKNESFAEILVSTPTWLAALVGVVIGLFSSSASFLLSTNTDDMFNELEAEIQELEIITRVQKNAVDVLGSSIEKYISLQQEEVKQLALDIDKMSAELVSLKAQLDE